MATARRLIFVYGSLKEGAANHALLREATPLGPRRTRAGFALYDLGPYPAMLAGGSTAVEGELYAVSAALLATLDRFEDHPRLYLRTEIELEDGTRAEAYLWAGARPEAPPIATGRWPTAR